jgi:hypothetical protein
MIIWLRAFITGSSSFVANDSVRQRPIALGLSPNLCFNSAFSFEIGICLPQVSLLDCCIRFAALRAKASAVAAPDLQSPDERAAHQQASALLIGGETAALSHTILNVNRPTALSRTSDPSWPFAAHRFAIRADTICGAHDRDRDDLQHLRALQNAVP